MKHLIVVNQEQSLFGPPCPRRHQLRGGDGIGVVRLRHCAHHRRGLLHHALHVGHYRQAQGAVHAHMAALQHMATGRWALDLHDDDIYWCTADPGWVTGTSYGMSRALDQRHHTGYLRGGLPRSAWYQVIQKYGVTVWYTAPTAIRMLMKAGDEIPKRYDLSSLRYMCSVGEPLNPEAIMWGAEGARPALPRQLVADGDGGDSHCQLPLNGHQAGSMGRPIPGVEAAIVDEAGNRVEPGEEGDLCVRPGWPSMFRTYWRNQEMYDSKFKERMVRYGRPSRAWMRTATSCSLGAPMTSSIPPAILWAFRGGERSHRAPGGGRGRGSSASLTRLLWRWSRPSCLFTRETSHPTSCVTT